MKLFTLDKKKTCFECFRNFDPKPKGGPQASLALAKGGPQGNLKKFKKCLKPFEIFMISSETILLGDKHYVIN